MAYRVEEETIGQRKVLHLHDDDTGARASVLPSYGFNLYDLRLPVGGEVRPIVVSDASFVTDPKSPGRNGTPVLFPFPNRIRDAKFSYQGKNYQLPANNGPNAIHGFAIQAPWDVVETRADGTGAFVVGEYQISRHSPEMRANWPSDGILRIRYGLSHGRLSLEATIANPSDGSLPYGFGIHPYFHLPFSAHGDPAKTAIILPAEETWVLKDFLPTGERKAVDSRLDFREGQPIAGQKLDDVLTGLPAGTGNVCRLVDQNASVEFRISMDRNFRELVVFTPPWFENCIAVEPYTQTTDAINLQARGIDGGLRELPPGMSESLLLVMETKPVG